MHMGTHWRFYIYKYLSRSCAVIVTCPLPGPDGEGVRGYAPHPEKNKTKAIGFLSNTGLDPLKNHKAIEPTFNVRPSSAK